MTSGLCPDDLRDATAPWRVRRSLTLSEAMSLATAAGLLATIESRAEPRLSSATVFIRGGGSVEFLELRCEGLPAAGICGPGCETEDGVHEFVVPLPESVVASVLVLSSGVEEREIPVIAGDPAAVAAYGWSDQSVGRRAELLVSGDLLDQALKHLLTGGEPT